MPSQHPVHLAPPSSPRPLPLLLAASLAAGHGDRAGCAVLGGDGQAVRACRRDAAARADSGDGRDALSHGQGPPPLPPSLPSTPPLHTRSAELCTSVRSSRCLAACHSVLPVASLLVTACFPLPRCLSQRTSRCLAACHSVLPLASLLVAAQLPLASLLVTACFRVQLGLTATVGTPDFTEEEQREFMFYGEHQYAVVRCEVYKGVRPPPSTLPFLSCLASTAQDAVLSALPLRASALPLRCRPGRLPVVSQHTAHAGGRRSSASWSATRTTISRSGPKAVRGTSQHGLSYKR